MFVRQATFLAFVALRAKSLLLDGKTGDVTTAAAVTLECPVSCGPKRPRDCKTFPHQQACFCVKALSLVKIIHSDARDKYTDLINL